MTQKTAAAGKAIAVATAIMAVSNLLSRALGLLRVVILARMAGASSAVDAYSFSFLIPDLLNHILAGSALSITFIPLFQEFLSKNDRKGAWRFFSNVFTTGTALFLVFIAFSELYADKLLLISGKNISDPGDPAKFALTVKLTRIILPAQLFFFWGALLNGVQYAHKRFFFPALAPLMYNIGIILGGLLLYPVIGIEGFSWGVLVGAFAGNVLIQIPGARAAGMRFHTIIDVRDVYLARYALTTLPFIIGLSMQFAHEALFRFFGSYIPDGDGALASLDYAFKIMAVLIGVFGQSVAAGSYPFLSQLTVEGRLDEAARLLNRLLLRTGSLLAPCAGVGIMLSGPLVAVLLQRGAFDAESTRQTASVLSVYLTGSFFFAGTLISSRAFYAMGKTVLPLALLTSAVGAMIPVFWMLTRSLGALGVALASAITMVLQFLLVYGVWSKKYGGKAAAGALRDFIVLAVATGIGMALCRVLTPPVAQTARAVPSVFVQHLLIIVFAGLPSLLAAFTLLQLTGVQDILRLLKGLFARFGAARSSGDAPAERS